MKKYGVLKIATGAAPAVLAILFWAASARAAYVSFNSTAEFATYANPNGVWSYGDWGGSHPFTLRGTIEDWGSVRDPIVDGLWAWERNPGQYDPAIIYNYAETPVSNWGFTWPAKSVSLDNFYCNEASGWPCIAFTAPSNGVYDLSAAFNTLADNGASGGNIFVGFSGFSGGYEFAGSGVSGTYSHAGVAMTSGQSVYFVSANGAGVTLIDITVTGNTVDSNQWTGNTTGSWNDSANWSMGAVPNDVGATADLLGLIFEPATITVNSPVTVGVLTINNTANQYTIDGASAIRLQNSGTSGAVVNIGGNHVISAPILQNGPLSITFNNPTDSLTLSGTFTEESAGSITVGGGGVLTLANFPSPASTEAFNLGGGTLNYTGARVTVTRPVNLNNDCTITVADALTFNENFNSTALNLTKNGSGSLNFTRTTAGTTLFYGNYNVQTGTVHFDGVVDSVYSSWNFKIADGASTSATLGAAGNSRLTAVWLHCGVNGGSGSLSMSGASALSTSTTTEAAQFGVNGGSAILTMAGTSSTEFPKLNLSNSAWFGVDVGGGPAHATVDLSGYAELHTATLNAIGNTHLGWGTGSTVSMTLSGHAKLACDGANGGTSGGGILDIADASSTAVVTLKDFSVLDVPNQHVFIGGNVTGVGNGAIGAVTLQDSAAFNAGRVVMVGDSLSSGELNLKGGIFSAPALVKGAASVASTINFDGGTLKAVIPPERTPDAPAALGYYDATVAMTASGLNDFIQGTGFAVNVLEGGAKFDTNALDVTVTQVLAHAGTAATDGGLMKLGDGSLTLTVLPTYTGDTTVNQGTLNANAGINTPNATIFVADGAILNAPSIVADTLAIGGMPMATAVPEPGTFALFTLALVGGAAFVSLRKK